MAIEYFSSKQNKLQFSAELRTHERKVAEISSGVMHLFVVDQPPAAIDSWGV